MSAEKLESSEQKHKGISQGYHFFGVTSSKFFAIYESGYVYLYVYIYLCA